MMTSQIFHNFFGTLLLTLLKMSVIVQIEQRERERKYRIGTIRVSQISWNPSFMTDISKGEMIYVIPRGIW